MEHLINWRILTQNWLNSAIEFCLAGRVGLESAPLFPINPRLRVFLPWNEESLNCPDGTRQLERRCQRRDTRASQNQRSKQTGSQFANTLFAAASQTLAELLGDPKYLGARIGVLCALHTWKQTLLPHIHLHCLVTAGGLDKFLGRWLEHVPPHRFQTVRGYGHYCGNQHSRLAEAHLVLGADSQVLEKRTNSSWQQLCESAGMGKACRCPTCGRKLISHHEFKSGRSPPLMAFDLQPEYA